MTEPGPSGRPSQAYPAPWRSNPEGPDAQTLLLEQSREEELFQRIMGQAQNEKTPLNELLASAMRLAFPKAKDSDLEHALGTFKARNAAWQDSIDLDGNPCWISLPLRERDKNKAKAQPGVARSSAARKTKNAAPEKKDAVPKFLRGLIRLVVFGAIFALLYYFLIVRGHTMP
jgi:hypothetical protein